MTEAVTERNLGVPRAYASFAVPLGSTTKMDGCASVYPALAAIFVAQFYGVHLDIFAVSADYSGVGVGFCRYGRYNGRYRDAHSDPFDCGPSS